MFKQHEKLRWLEINIIPSDHNGLYFEHLNVYLIFDRPTYSYVKKSLIFMYSYSKGLGDAVL